MLSLAVYHLHDARSAFLLHLEAFCFIASSPFCCAHMAPKKSSKAAAASGAAGSLMALAPLGDVNTDYNLVISESLATIQGDNEFVNIVNEPPLEDGAEAPFDAVRYTPRN